LLANTDELRALLYLRSPLRESHIFFSDDDFIKASSMNALVGLLLERIEGNYLL
jgi:hypothetical protein